MVFECPSGQDLDITNHGFVFELSGNPNDLQWKRNEIYLPEGWGSAICDYERCYFQWVGERPLNLSANQQSTFDVHLYNNINATPPGDMAGDSAVIEICVFEANNPANEQCTTLTFICDRTSAVEDEIGSREELVLSPNPTNGYFKVANNDKIGKVEVINIIGAKLKTFDTRESSAYDVSELPSGIYLVRLYDKNDSRVLSTLRLKKL